MRRGLRKFETNSIPPSLAIRQPGCPCFSSQSGAVPKTSLNEASLKMGIWLCRKLLVAEPNFSIDALPRGPGHHAHPANHTVEPPNNCSRDSNSQSKHATDAIFGAHECLFPTIDSGSAAYQIESRTSQNHVSSMSCSESFSPGRTNSGSLKERESGRAHSICIADRRRARRRFRP